MSREDIVMRITARLALLVVVVLVGSQLMGLQTVAAPPTDAQDASAGKVLAFDRAKGNCLACHTMKGGDVASTVGPELSGLKQRFPNPADLAAIIHDEETRNPQTVMPAFGKNLILDDKEIHEVVAFLYTL